MGNQISVVTSTLTSLAQACPAVGERKVATHEIYPRCLGKVLGDLCPIISFNPQQPLE